MFLFKQGLKIPPPGEMITKTKKTFYLVSARGSIFDKSPFPVRAPFSGSEGWALTRPRKYSANIYLGNSPRGSYRVFR